MKVLVACEFSGIVREAFRARGHDAWSCDLLPTEIPSANHHIGDVRELLRPSYGWDLMIAHPPCTYLTVSNARRWQENTIDRMMALMFVETLMNAPISRIAIENPVGAIGTEIRPSDQIIHPFMFGHDEKKQTCLWLKELPVLVPTRDPLTAGNRYEERIHRMGPSADRWKNRSRTFPGIAKAMASQWG